MKKILAILLAIMMLGTCSFAFAEEEMIEHDFYDDMSDEYRVVLDLYKQAREEKWDVEKLTENKIYPMLNTLDDEAVNNIMVDFVDFENGIDFSMIVYTRSEEGVEVLAVYHKNADGSFDTVAVAAERYGFFLAMKDEDLVLVGSGSNSAFQSGMFFFKQVAGTMQLIEGVIWDYEADAENPCFHTTEADWDVSKATPITEEEANAIIAGYDPEGVDLADPMGLGD